MQPQRESRKEGGSMPWKLVLLAAALAGLAACGNARHELAHTRKSDPVWPLNPARWDAGENDLTSPRDTP